MAVASSPVSKKNASHQKGKIVSSSKKEKSSQKQSENGLSSPKKRNNCPGVRVVGGRIYDSLNGKTCHQCRQKTTDFGAACKNKENKQCPIMFCHKCLLNRYGEKAEEVATREDWICPKCKGICNCSVCMKKRGHQPTGILVHTAKATGFSSVSEMLHVKGPENSGHDKNIKDLGALPMKEAMVFSPRKRGKENSFDGNIDSNLHSPSLDSKTIERKTKKMKRQGMKDMHDDSRNDALSKETGPDPDEKKSKRMKLKGLKEVHHGNRDGDACLKVTTPHPDEKKDKKMKQEGFKQMHKGNDDEVVFLKKTSPRLDEKKPNKLKQEGSKEMHDKKRDAAALLKEPSPKRPQISHETSNNKLKTKVDVLREGKDYRTMVPKKASLDPFGNEKRKEDKNDAAHSGGQALDSMKNHADGPQIRMVVESYEINGSILTHPNIDADVDIPLPQGTELTTVGGIDLQPEDVGNALQFLEFCMAFGKVLDVKKGQAESVLRELMHGRSGRRGKYSSAVQFHVQLLSVIQEELEEESPVLSPINGKTSWFHALKKCASGSMSLLSSLQLDFLDRGVDGYDMLDSSKKLRLLNFLCDETLGTAKIRNWIDDQNSKFVEKAKEARERVLAARNKEKSLKQKMRNEIAETIIAKNGAPLSISEHEAIVSQIKSEAAHAHAEMLETKGLVPKNNKKPDALRTDPILLDFNGNAYWRLKGYFDKSDVLLQDVGNGDAVALDEKWFAFDVEQKAVIEKHIYSISQRRLGPQRVFNRLPSQSTKLVA